MKGYKGLLSEIDYNKGAAIHDLTNEAGTVGSGFFIL
jgi:hypothetical protein